MDINEKIDRYLVEKQQKCPKCGSYEIEYEYMNSRVPWPKDKKGQRRYQCTDCGKKFKK